MSSHNDQTIDKEAPERSHHEKLDEDVDGVINFPLISAFAEHTKVQIYRKFWRLVLTGLAVSIGGMYVGYCSSATGSIIANPGFIKQFGTVETAEGLAIDAEHVSLWNGMGYVGQVVCQMISPFVADRFGRKASMYVLIFMMLAAIILEIVSKDWKVFLAAKILGGGAAGFLGTAIMTYLSEIAITQIRGAFLGAFSLSFAIGQLGIAIGLQVLVKTNPMKFRNAFYSQFVVFGLFAMVVAYVPESPAWLCMKGKDDQAKKALRRLIGNVEGYNVEHEYAVIKSEIAQSEALAASQGSSDWNALFKWANFKRCIAATLPFSYQNFVGTPLIFGYTTYFFQLAGLAEPFLGSLIISIILICGVCLSFYTVERVGRRTSVLWAGATMGVIDVAIGGSGFAKPTAAFGAGLITLCSLWVLVYSLSLAPIGWTSVVEVSSPRLRAKTAAVAVVLQSCSNILFSYVVPYMLSDQYAGWGPKIGFLFGGLSFLFWIPCYFLLPETKGRTYGELDELYESGIPVRNFASAKTRVQMEREVGAEVKNKV